MSLSATDLALIRDESGTAPPPLDVDLSPASDDTAALPGGPHWLPVAIRSLKRRRAAVVGGGGGSVEQLNLSGVLAVTLSKADTVELTKQIQRLEYRWQALSGNPADEPLAGSGRLQRRDVERGYPSPPYPSYRR